MEVRSTQDGILRAFALLVAKQSKPRQTKQKYVYRPSGNAIHASRRLTKTDPDAVNAITDQLKNLDPRDNDNTKTIEGLLMKLSKQPVKFVPMKLEQRVDRSKSYPYRSTKRGG